MQLITTLFLLCLFEILDLAASKYHNRVVIWREDNNNDTLLSDSSNHLVRVRIPVQSANSSSNLSNQARLIHLRFLPDNRNSKDSFSPSYSPFLSQISVRFPRAATFLDSQEDYPDSLAEINAEKQRNTSHQSVWEQVGQKARQIVSKLVDSDVSSRLPTRLHAVKLKSAPSLKGKTVEENYEDLDTPEESPKAKSRIRERESTSVSSEEPPRRHHRRRQRRRRCKAKWEEWSRWSPCSRRCGGCGFRTRSRRCQKSGNGDCECQGKRSERRSCRLEVCAFPRVSCCGSRIVVFYKQTFICVTSNLNKKGAPDYYNSFPIEENTSNEDTED